MPVEALPAYTLIHSRRKTVALIVQPDGSLVVRAPLRATRRQVEEVVQSRLDWIHRAQEKMRKAQSAHPVGAFKPGAEFPFLGRLYRLRLAANNRQPLTLGSVFTLDRRDLPQARQVFEQWYRAQARLVIGLRVETLARQHDFKVAGVRISGAKTRWGSCSAAGTLSFTWRLVLLPVEVIDYVAVHELVHLRIKNHQKAFWERVAAILPDYKAQRKWLRENGNKLAAMLG